MTKTAEVADVLLPATSWGTRRRLYLCRQGFQRFGQAIQASGNVKRDWEIISLLATEMGYPMHYADNQQIWDEMRALCPLFYGVTYEKWAKWATCNGRARRWIIRERHTCTKTISSTPQPARGSSLLHRGAHRQKPLMMTTLLCSARCVKWDIIRADQ